MATAGGCEVGRRRILRSARSRRATAAGSIYCRGRGHGSHFGDGAAGGAHGVVHVEQRIGDVRSLQGFDECERFGAAMGGEFIERGIHRIVLQFFRFAGIEDGEARVEFGGDGVFPEQPGAETVNGGDPGGFDFAQKDGVVANCSASFALHVGGGLFSEGDGEDFVGPEIVQLRRAPYSVPPRTVVLPEPGPATTQAS